MTYDNAGLHAHHRVTLVVFNIFLGHIGAIGKRISRPPDTARKSIEQEHSIYNDLASEC